MSKIAVVFHSGYGHTRRVAEYVAEGAGAELLAIDAEGNLPDGGWEKLADADAIIFGTPTYMGGASWQFKKFADASSKPWFGRVWQDKVFGGFTNSASMNGDKGATMFGLQTLASQHGGIWVSLGMLPSNAKAAARTDLITWAARSACWCNRRPMPVLTRSPRAISIPPRPTARVLPR